VSGQPAGTSPADRRRGSSSTGKIATAPMSTAHQKAPAKALERDLSWLLDGIERDLAGERRRTSLSVRPSLRADRPWGPPQLRCPVVRPRLPEVVERLLRRGAARLRPMGIREIIAHEILVNRKVGSNREMPCKGLEGISLEFAIR
jgi:hypothetical protein